MCLIFPIEINIKHIKNLILQDDIRLLRVDYVSNLLFAALQDKRLIVIDWFQGCRYATLSDFPNPMTELVLKPDLSQYTGRILSRLTYSGYQDFLTQNEEYKAYVFNQSGGKANEELYLVGIKALGSFFNETKKWFSAYPEKEVFFKKNKSQKILMACTFRSKKMMFFFGFDYKFRRIEIEKNSPVETHKNLGESSFQSSSKKFKKSKSLFKSGNKKSSRGASKATGENFKR